MNENYNQKNLMKLDLQNITNYDAFIDYLGKIIKDQPQISPYYIIQILEFDISKYQKINTKQEMTIANYFKKILNIYKNEICPRDLVSLCIYVNDVNVVEDIIRKITDKLDIVFCSIDIIKTRSNSYYVLEINSGVMMKNLLLENEEISDKIKKIYSDAIDLMFKK